MEENGFHRSKVTISEERDEPQHQVNLTFHVVPGHAPWSERSRWKATRVIPSNRSRRSPSCIPAIRSPRVALRARCNAFAAAIRSRTACLPRSRWPAAPTIPSATLWTTFSKSIAARWCEIAAEGFKLSQRVLHRLVPIYEEGALDDDLLNEGRRNIQNHLQTLGYFEATVGVSQHNAAGRQEFAGGLRRPSRRAPQTSCHSYFRQSFFSRRTDSRAHAGPIRRTPVQSRALQRSAARRGRAKRSRVSIGRVVTGRLKSTANS